MRTNYINQLQRDILGGEDGGINYRSFTNTPTSIIETMQTYTGINPQEQSILSIEDKAKEYVAKEYKDMKVDGTILLNAKEDFVAGANEMLSIIKELGELLKEMIEIRSSSFVLDELQSRSQKTLDKYKNYL